MRQDTSVSDIVPVRRGFVSAPAAFYAPQHVQRVGLLFERADAIDREVAAAGWRCERLTQAVLARAFAGKLVA
ncbi:hypothetical protein [uncultured Methanoregula sp.]|uniref:hypothetical protein n=1 Tax=uncultured Methanoregula sp. TaxID=1005933 RepID=UPI002AAB254F|nr:hypothetical protein [uncultured Methanoregula sp.]